MDEIFKDLNRRYKTPKQVQDFLRRFPYNSEKGKETQRSALRAYESGTLHCLEAALLAAAILEESGHPPLVLSLESVDELDHVVFIFKSGTGWGAVGKSRLEGLHGRRPVFRSVRDLAWSYFDPFIDKTGRLTGYGVCNLDEIGADWRASKRNVWKVVHHLVKLPHQRIRSSLARYKKGLRHYRQTGESGWRQPTWW
jgi:hypothetical protein